MGTCPWTKFLDADPWIRHAARNVLERWPNNGLEMAVHAQDPTKSVTVTALLALARSNNKEVLPRILKRLNEVEWSKLWEADKLTIRSCGILVPLYLFWHQ